MNASFAVAAGLTAICAAVAAPAPARAQEVAESSRAQELVVRTVARHPELIGLDLHAMRPNGAESVIVASRDADRIGRKTAAEDLEAFQTGAPRVFINAEQRTSRVLLQLVDAAGRPVGSLRMILPYQAGTDTEALLLEKAGRIRDEMRQQIPALAKLFESGAGVQGERDPQDPDRQARQDKQTLPMTKEVVSGQTLEQSAQEGYSEAVKSVAGVSPANSRGTSNDAINIRGIKLNLFSNYRLNGGLPVAGVITTPTENKERIEALKGANALMFGVASPAGIINLVTKRATAADVTSLAILGNHFGQFGVSLDVGRRFGPEKQLGVRLNGSIAHLENGVRSVGGTSHFASIGLDWIVTPRIKLQGDAEYYARHVGEQGGISLLRPYGGNVRITPVVDPRNLLTGAWQTYRPETKNFQVRGDYGFLDGWTLMGEIGRSYANRSRFSVRIGDYDIDTGAGGVARVNTVRQDYTNAFERGELLGKFSTWFLGHDLTAGVSRSLRESGTPMQNNVVLAQRQNIYDPVDLPAPVFTTPATSLPLQTSQDVGIYAYDAISIGPRWKLLLGLRNTNSKEDNGVRKAAANLNTPAFGVLFDLLPTLTLFASYMEGLEAGATAPLTAVNAYEILEAAVSTQKEIGFSDSTLKGVSLSASYFEIKRANAVTDPTTGIFAQNGHIDYKGVEATLGIEFLRRWTLNAGGQWMRAVQRAPDPQIDGLAPENTPSALGNVRLSYRPEWVKGLTLNAGVSFITRRFVNPQDQGAIPGYALYTTGIGYKAKLDKRQVAFNLTVDNLANLRYWNSVQTGTYGIGMDRSVKMGAKLDL